MSATAGTAGVVLAERQDGVLTMTINRPAQMNAVNHEVAEQLAAALDTLDEDPGLSVGVITGAGGTFCAGMDLKAFARGRAAGAARPRVRRGDLGRDQKTAGRRRRRLGAGRRL